jgi:dihydroorotate dehydrogenase (NAD+) catalytic subunit
LSGPAIRPYALGQVKRVSAAASVPVIGMGGIESGADALAFLASGATAVAVGTASFRDPMAGARVRCELEEALEGVGPEASGDVIGRIRTSTST